MNPLAIALQGVGFGALLVAAQGFVVVDIQPVQPSTPGNGFGGGTWTKPTPRWSVPGHQSNERSIEIPILAYNESDEEEIILAVLIRIAQMEYYA